MKVTNYATSKSGAKNSVIAVACEKCGHIMVVKTGKSITSFKSLATIARSLLTVCPACGTEVAVREKHSVFGPIAVHKDAAKEMALKLQEEQLEAVEKELETLKNKVKKPEDLPETSPETVQIRGNVQELKQYLDHIISLEVNSQLLDLKIKLLSKRKAEEFQKAADAQLDAVDKANRADRASAKKVEALEQKITKLEEEFEAKDWEKGAKARKVPAPKEPEYLDEAVPAEPHCPALKKPGAEGTYPGEPKYPELKTPGFFNKKKVQEENNQRIAQYEAAVAAYRSACEKENAQKLTQYEADMEAYHRALEQLAEAREKNAALRQAYELKLQKHRESFAQRQEKAVEEAAQRKKEARAELDETVASIRREIADIAGNGGTPRIQLQIGILFDQEIEAAKEQLKQISLEMNRLYSLNVIYPTYRELPAEAAFYEYLSSGRCQTLEGSHGAYNLFESECRSDLVSRIIRSLDEIKQGQVILQRHIKAVTELMKEYDQALDKALPFIRKIEEEKMEAYLQDNRSKGKKAFAAEKQDSKETAIVKFFRQGAAMDQHIAAEISRVKDAFVF